MSCCNECTTYTSNVFYDGSYNAATGITGGDDTNEIIQKLITYIDNSGGLTFVQGTGIGLMRTGSTITISNLAPNQTQVLSISGSTLSLSNGGGNVIIPNVGSSQVNSDWTSVSGVSQILNKPNLAAYLQTLSYNSGTGVLTISGSGSTVNLPVLPYTAGSGISISGTTITNTAPNTNQTLSIAGNVISLTSGGSVTLPSQSYNTPIYSSAATLNTSATPNADTYILAATTTTINLTAATSEPLGKSIGFKVASRGTPLSFTGGVVKNFATTVTSVDVNSNSFIRLVIADNGGGKIWELIQFNANVS